MKLSKLLEKEIREMYIAFWDSYMQGDKRKFFTYLNKIVRMTGTTAGEDYNNKVAVKKFIDDTQEQVVGKVDFRNRKISISPLDSYYLVYEQMHLYILVGSEWTFYAKVRISAIVRKEKTEWKFIQLHASIPDAMTEEGETIAMQKISKENLELREAVKRRTVELESKNRELEIETSLERVRARAMSMQHSDELAELVATVFKELTQLGFSLTSCIIWIHEHEQASNTLWIASAEMSKPAQPFRIESFYSPFFKSIIPAWKAKDPKWIFTLTGVEKKNFEKAFFKELPDLPDGLRKALKVPRQVVFSASFNNFGALEIVETAALTDEKFNILHRFGKVFDSSYTRFNDLKKAEAQTREAQIELSLERVRARTMAMHKSDELVDTSVILFQELRALGVKAIRTGVAIIDDEREIMELWSSQLIEQKQNKVLGIVPMQTHPFFKGLLRAWRQKDDEFTFEFKGVKVKEFYETMSSLISYPAQDSYNPSEVFSPFFFPEGSLTVVSYEQLTNEERNIMQRFARVFGLLYRRFLDLQKAEEQAKEAQIELGLERVRARAMAMQKSDELKELIGTVSAELTKLDIVLDRCFIAIFDPKTNGSTWWMASPETPSNPTGLFMKYHEMPPYLAYLEAWREGKLKWQYVLEGAVKKGWDNFIFDETGFSYLPDFVIANMKANDKVFLNASFNSFGCLSLATLETLSDEHFDILLRFARVFDLTYTRFNDLQKAEAQAREAQIEVGLERVRSRAMAMHKTDELLDAAELVFKELSALGINSMNVSYAFVDKEEKYASYYSLNPVDGKIPPFPFVFPHTETEVMRSILSSWKKQEPFNVIELDEEATLIHQTYIGGHVQNLITKNKIDIPFSVEAFLAISPKKAVLYSFNFAKGYLFNIGGERLTTMQEELLLRFTKVFEQTYTRFLDLQNAEAQSREAQIELAMERVRARTMAMQRSDELAEAATLVFHQFSSLGLLPEGSRVFFSLIDEDTVTSEVWTTKEDGILRPGSHRISLRANNHLKDVYVSWKGRKSIYNRELSGSELADYLKYIGSIPYLKEDKVLKQVLITPPDRLVFTEAFFAQGTIGIVGLIPLTQESQNTLMRFSKVFEQTYTRFLDLQKAEAQAREAQIEAALERVRSRSMGMQNSEELKEVIQVVYEQFVHLNIHVEHTGFIMDYKTRDDMHIWLADKHAVPFQVTIPYFDCAHWNSFNEAREKGLDFFANHLSFEEKNKFYQDLFKVIPGLPEETLEYYFSCPGLAISTVLLENVGLYIENFSGIPYSEEENNALMRFGKVFQQTYTRFYDLQKAEAQAREATIEAALEKVRGKAMAMHNSNDLTVTASMVFTELRKLNIYSIRSGVGLLTKESRKVTLYAATSSEEGDNLSLVGWSLLQDHTVLSEIYDSWIRQEDYFPVLKGELLKTYYEKIKSSFKVPDSQAGYEQYGYFLAFSEGCFYGWSEKPYTETEIKILNRFKMIIDLTFRRYIELQRSEANARDAVRRASLDRVRAETASMRTTADLERITPLIWSELTTLGVPFIRCGVFIMDQQQQQIHTFLSTPDGKAIAAFHLPYTSPGTTAQVLEHWLKKKMYKEHWDEAAFLEWTKNLVAQGAIGSSEKYVTEHHPTNLDLHFLPFLQGMLYVGSETPLGDEELHLVQSLADAFSTAYARYEDFNKLEAAKKQVDNTLNELQVTQKQLIQSEKMASLGELTAGIAHEIQNPLNFVNNFSEVNKELLLEMQEEIENGNMNEVKNIANDVIANEEKINEHGKRADSIVKGMLQHSRSTSNAKEPTDINALADEYLRLAYHGLRAKDKSFNATLETDYDKNIGKINIIPQDIGRVILNLINNAFYAVTDRKNQNEKGYEPIVRVSTRKSEGMIELRVQDNGRGIPEQVLDKIFQPFFTTKPTGQGTGLGLSLSYDIVKAHGGELKVETMEGKGTEFTIVLSTN